VILLANFGVVISASHNSYEYNGLKILNNLGEKIDKRLEIDIEKHDILLIEYKVDEFGASLGNTFFYDFIKVLIVSFILMSFVVFLNFKSFVPSIAVIQAAIFDAVVALAGMSLFGIPLTMYTFAAILMLIGYSVDTDILLNTRVLKGKFGSVTDRILDAFDTGIMLTLSSLIVAILMFIISSYIGMLQLTQISIVLCFGLIGDIISTWFTNAGILISYLKKD
jgi:preprotein translocase subunit SecF